MSGPTIDNRGFEAENLTDLADDAGFDMVLARSAFSQNLPQILKRHSAV